MGSIDYADFKAEVYNERMDWEAGSPLCAMCGEPVGEYFNLHHTIVTRAMAMGWARKLRDVIHHKYNVLIVHPNMCHMQAHAYPKLGVAMLITMYGWEEINEWFFSLPWKNASCWWNRGLTEEEAKEMVDEIQRVQ